MSAIKNLKFKMLLTFALLIFAAILYFLPISCVFLALTGIPCLGCGMTRALLAALCFDFNTAFSYHLMFWSVPLLYLCFLLDGRLFKQKWANVLFYTLIILGFILNWLYHIANFAVFC